MIRRINPYILIAGMTGVAATLAVIAVILALVLLLGGPASAATPDEPPDLAALLEGEPGRSVEITFADEARQRAMKAAALAWGAQSGLAHRGWQISRILELHGPQLTRIYRFRELMLREGGFLVQPPVLAETREAFLLERTHDRAAAAGRILRIVSRERIVSAVPGWRDYLVRDWETPEPPAEVLFPRTAVEKRRWQGWLREGWSAGVELADAILVDDLDRLNAIFTGIILWHRLELAGMVSRPELGTHAVAVSGGGAAMRIDERFIVIDGHAGLLPAPEQWRPAITVTDPEAP